MILWRSPNFLLLQTTELRWNVSLYVYFIHIPNKKICLNEAQTAEAPRFTIAVPHLLWIAWLVHAGKEWDMDWCGCGIPNEITLQDKPGRHAIASTLQGKWGDHSELSSSL